MNAKSGGSAGIIAAVMDIDALFSASPWLLGFTLPALALVLAPVVARFARTEAEMPADRLIARIARRSAKGAGRSRGHSARALQ
jgi:glutathione S-transferase